MLAPEDERYMSQMKLLESQHKQAQMVKQIRNLVIGFLLLVLIAVLSTALNLDTFSNLHHYFG